ncbi:multidrug efflux SMR transporter [Acetobacteraceae bacterium]|nr:multidrug efflux SMR transporter [Acetobacteraceae bacterium]
MNTFLPWVYLGFAILLEVIATSLMNKSAGFSKVVPAISVLALYGVSFFCMARALIAIPVGLAYAIWCGCGIVAIAFISLLFFKQHLSWLAWAGIGFIFLGTILAVIGGGLNE